MAKWYGVIGYAETSETRPGIYEEQIIEKSYRGDILQTTRRLQSSGQVNDDVEITNRISIIADPTITDMNFQAMRYISFMGAKWKITSVEIQYPRLILTVGGLYNGS